jgi:putative oxidoreductase
MAMTQSYSSATAGGNRLPNRCKEPFMNVASTSPLPLPTRFGITLLRVSLGAMWIAHALLKLLVYTLPGTVQFFDSVGIPGLLAYPVFVVELLGGIALIAGFYARQVALALIPVMIAAASVHLPNGWVFTSTGGGWEYPVFLTMALFALWLLGDGVAAIRRSNFLVPGAQRPAGVAR